WDAASGKPVGAPPVGPAKPAQPARGYAAFGPDRRRAVVGSPTSPAEVRDVNTGSAVGPASQLRSMTAAAFRPGGKRLAPAGPGVVWLCNADTSRPDAPALFCRGSITALAFCPDGKLLAAGGTFRRVWLWDVPTHSPVGDGLPHTGHIACLAFSP